MESEFDKQSEMAPNFDDYKFDGTTYFYTDKESNTTYSWNVEKNRWEVKNDVSEQYNKSNATTQPNTLHSKNDNEEENDSDDESVEKKPEAVRQDLTQGHYSYEGDTHLYTDPNDGTVYFWDKDKKAWFPKIDDTFIAYYQLSYGFTAPAPAPASASTIDTSIKENDLLKNEANRDVSDLPGNLKRKAEPEPAKWFNLDDEHNTKVYVSNLPPDITETEFVDLMQKCGLVMKDLDSGKMKIKLYTDPVTKTLKGDALCTYIKKESVELALKLLDDYEFRGKKIKVEKARFTMKGSSYDPSLKPKKKRRKDKEKLKKMQEKLFAWQPDKLRGERSKHECVVVIKNLFDPRMFDENLGLIIEYREDIKEECLKCGVVKKVVVYDTGYSYHWCSFRLALYLEQVYSIAYNRLEPQNYQLRIKGAVELPLGQKHEDGVAQVWFKEAEAADACVQLLHNRWFGKRLITAETWDGKTKYKVQETKEEAEARLKKWEAFLNGNKGNEEQAAKVDDCPANCASGIATTNADDSDGTRSSAGSADETEDDENDADNSPAK